MEELLSRYSLMCPPLAIELKYLEDCHKRREAASVRTFDIFHEGMQKAIHMPLGMSRTGQRACARRADGGLRIWMGMMETELEKHNNIQTQRNAAVTLLNIAEMLCEAMDNIMVGPELRKELRTLGRVPEMLLKVIEDIRPTVRDSFYLEAEDGHEAYGEELKKVACLAERKHVMPGLRACCRALANLEEGDDEERDDEESENDVLEEETHSKKRPRSEVVEEVLELLQQPIFLGRRTRSQTTVPVLKKRANGDNTVILAN
jgi:TATA-binding protein-associated factor Taf7